ncbi:MAG: hypothetical protein AB7O67_18580 [Vicinamibacterales bacterium]
MIPAPRPLVLVSILVLALCAVAAPADAQLVVLETTGEVRAGLPVVHAASDAGAALAILSRGYSGRLLRLYALEQEFLRRLEGRTPMPAYLVFTDQQGGFPRAGFVLEGEPRPEVAWVDLHRGSRLSGRFGAVDQIFPHELLHVIVRQLAGEPPPGGGNQVHAIGVRTDPVTAFNEGFAEHAQILAVDDADAVADTQALRNQADVRERADRAVAAYARELTRQWWPLAPSQLRFLLWFGQAEQVQRYYTVKANLFARAPAVPEALRRQADGYPAYLYQSVVPGAAEGPVKPAAVSLSTEGVVSHLFWRLVTDPSLQQRYRDEAFYEAFGTSRDVVTPFENVYLKLFRILHDARPATTADVLRAWMRRMPEDAADVRRLAREALGGQDVPDAPEIWLANDALMTGTSLYDQYRAQPRPHTFDANAATALDWRSVTGIDAGAAARLLAGAPYDGLPDLLASPGLSDDTRARVSAMAAAMDRVLDPAAREEERLSLGTLAVPYLWRILAIVFAATLAGAWLASRAGIREPWAAIAVAFAASLLVILLSWVVTSPAWYPVAAPVLLGGAPWAAWRAARGQGTVAATTALAAWFCAALPALLLTRPW